MQISLTFHPDAFPDLNQAFDPASNADYGARFLMQLYERPTPGPKPWKCITPPRPRSARSTGQRVYAALPEEQRLADISQPIPIASLWSSPFGRQGLFAPLHQGAPHVIPQAANPMGGAPPGRALDFYRSNPVRLTFRLQ